MDLFVSSNWANHFHHIQNMSYGLRTNASYVYYMSSFCQGHAQDQITGLTSINPLGSQFLINLYPAATAVIAAMAIRIAGT